MLFFRKLIILSAGVILLLTASGCKSKEKNPENLDPIYKELQSTHSEYSRLIESTEKEIIALKNEIKTAEPNTKELHQARKKLRQAESALIKVRQMERCYKIRVERRRVEDLKNYSIAFEKGEEWPNPAEYSAFLANKKLGESKKQWDSRVPKLQARLEEYLERQNKATAASNAPAEH